MHKNTVIDKDIIIYAYKNGMFPMADNADSDEVFWVMPKQRGILSIENLYISGSLRKLIRKKPFDISINTNFEAVINGCAEINENRKETWINNIIKESFIELHKEGIAHCVECKIEGELVGGLYGLALGGAFFGETMFSRKSNAGKIALIYLVSRLWYKGFSLLDTQWSNPHLEQFGCREIENEDYMDLLTNALSEYHEFCNPNTETKSNDEILSDYFRYRGFLYKETIAGDYI